MDANEIEKLKAIELDLFRNFLTVCEKYKLKYTLVGGTCLGAVRHQGMIPWDDDIDVALPRDDYNIFLKVAQAEFPDYIFLQTSFTDPEYPMNFAKMRNNNSTFIETSVSNFKMNHGVYLDIFPIDGCPNSKFKKTIRDFLSNVYSYRIGLEFLSSNKKTSLRRKISSTIIKIIFPNYKKAVIKRDKLLIRYKCSSCRQSSNYCGAWGKKEEMDTNIYTDTIKAVFEGLEVRIPKDYDIYLTKMYGDYMTPPPKEKQIGHHNCTIIDTECSYKKYI